MDQLLCEREPQLSREQAKRRIMAGEVYLNGQRCDKAGTMVNKQDRVEWRGEEERYVSRGGYKLEKAMQLFPISPAGRVCMDIGASTGGFCDCMLQNGAVKVYAVDVGYGQLAWKLRQDERVVNLERTNVRYLTGEQAPERIQFVSIDVSFISLRLVLPVAWRLMEENADLVALIKPQFEAGREQVGKHGVVRDREVHRAVIEGVLSAAGGIGFAAMGLTFSPIKGPQGNIEYLAWLRKCGGEARVAPEEIDRVVRESHEQLD